MNIKKTESLSEYSTSSHQRSNEKKLASNERKLT